MDNSKSLLTNRIGRLQLIVVAVVATATLLVGVLSVFSFGYRSADLHIALETAACLVAGLAAFLLYGRFERSGTLSDLGLFIALTVLTLYNVSAALSPAASNTIDRQAVWVPLFTQLVAASLLAAAAFAPRRPLRRPQLASWLLLGALAAVGLAVLIGLLLGPKLATGIDPSISPASSDRARIVGAPGLLACQLLAMSLLAAASIGFTIRAKRSSDEMLGWLALAATVAAFSRLNYFLFPSGYSSWVFTGDALRLGFYLLILVGAIRQISAYQRSAAEAAVLEERRRIARDLHDGLAQDLAFISMQAASLAEHDAGASAIAAAAERALADSRGAIVALSAPTDEPLGASVARLAGTLARRSGIDIELDMQDGIEASAERREALLRIVSEAISNAVRHGSPSSLTVRLRAQPQLRLSIADNGVGFDPALLGEARESGLKWMRERAAGLGGRFTLRTQPGDGTVVEVWLP